MMREVYGKNGDDVVVLDVRDLFHGEYSVEVREGRKDSAMKREQIFDTAHEAFFFLNSYMKHGWHGYIEPAGDKFRLVIVC